MIGLSEVAGAAGLIVGLVWTKEDSVIEGQIQSAVGGLER